MLVGWLRGQFRSSRTKGLVGRRTKGRQEETNMKLQEIVLKRNSMRFAAALLGNWPALLPVRMQLWLPRPSIMIRRRASTE
ncbi:MAG: hypothetical protein DME89_12745 [Verrucomicrobia bacterium]|nr:MAG: hypothetical protein DME89_12745 [Verrucomicrobiota bacterium]